MVGIAGLLGSGRTELARLLVGADHADSGQVEVAGKPVRLTSPRHGINHGIAYSPEDRRAEGILGDLTVAENIVLGIQARRGWRRIRKSERDAVVSEYIAALGVRPRYRGPAIRQRRSPGLRRPPGLSGPRRLSRLRRLSGPRHRCGHPRHPRRALSGRDVSRRPHE